MAKVKYSLSSGIKDLYKEVQPFSSLSDTAQCDGTGSFFVQIYSVFSPSPADDPLSA